MLSPQASALPDKQRVRRDIMPPTLKENRECGRILYDAVFHGALLAMEGCDGHEGNYSSAGIQEFSAASPGVKGEREKAVHCPMVFWGKYLAEMAAAVSGKLLCSGTLLTTPALIA